MDAAGSKRVAEETSLSDNSRVAVRDAKRAEMTDQQPLSGSMFLYERPELLSREEHGHLGLRRLDQPFAFAKDVRAVPLMVSEFRNAQRHCPVIFTDRDDPVPMAVLGVLGNRNVFIDDSGRWQVPGYVPAYLRCYPFTLATAATDRYALVIDRAADMIVEQPDVPFFDGDELSQPVQERMELCRTYQAEKQRTDAFCDMLKRLDLLVQQEVNHSVNGQKTPVAQYFGVHRDRLVDLDKDVVAELLRDGSLGAIVAHLFSLDNFEELIRLRQRLDVR